MRSVTHPKNRERGTRLEELQFELRRERVILRHERIFGESYKSN